MQNGLKAGHPYAVMPGLSCWLQIDSRMLTHRRGAGSNGTTRSRQDHPCKRHRPSSLLGLDEYPEHLNHTKSGQKDDDAGYDYSDRYG